MEYRIVVVGNTKQYIKETTDLHNEWDLTTDPEQAFTTNEADALNVKWEYVKSHGLELSDLYVELAVETDLIECPVCGEMAEEEFMVQSRFDYDTKICEQCRIDGN